MFIMINQLSYDRLATDCKPNHLFFDNVGCVECKSFKILTSQSFLQVSSIISFQASLLEKETFEALHLLFDFIMSILDVNKYVIPPPAL